MRKLVSLDKEQQNRPVNGDIGKTQKHDSAAKHVSGTARYIDDQPHLSRQLHIAVGKSSIARAKIISLDLKAVRSAPGVVAVITEDDIPGLKDIGPVYAGDPLLASKQVEFVGQAIFAVAATSHDLACRAAKLANIDQYCRGKRKTTICSSASHTDKR